MAKHINQKIEYIFWVVIFYIYILQDFLQRYVGVFRYFDEILAVLAIPLIMLNIVKRIKHKNVEMDKSDLTISLGILICIISGVISSIINKYQNFIVSAIDMFLVLKFFFTMYVVRFLFKKFDFSRYKEKISLHTKIVITLLFVLTIISYFTEIFPNGIRYGIKYVQLFYSHPSVLAMNVIFVLAIHFWASDLKNLNKYTMMALFMVAATLRAKAFCAVIIILILFFYILKIGKKVRIKEFAILGLLMVMIGYKQISFYFIEHREDSARLNLLTTSFQIAKDYFPIGTGFGAYGSFMSAENYSQVYYIYNLNNVFGLSENFNDFMCDSFWPMIIGQFGVLGTIGYVAAIIGIWIKIQKIYENDKNKYFSALMVFIYLLISSTSEAAFVHYMAMPMAFFIQIVLNESIEERKNEKND